jgi:hypothetical protein
MWQAGSRVLATRLDDEFWYPGSIHQVENARCFVLFDDGSECWAADDQLLPLQIDVGDRIGVRLPGVDKYTLCRVLRRDGERINVQFDDGTDEQTSLGMIRVDPTQWKDPGGTAPPSRWIIGDRVLAKWSGDAYWYPGTIQVIDGERMHVYYDDGDHEWVPADRVCENDLAVGSRVFVRFQRGPFYYPGRIARREGERIMVDYDDGQKEDTSIRWVRVRRDAAVLNWKVGQRVLAQWVHDPFFYPGVVQSIGENLIGIRYEDGDKAQVPPEAVLPLHLEVGDRVYARRQAARTYHPAVIDQREGDRLFLRYDDGQTEWSAIEYIRVLPAELPHLLG